MEGADGTSSKIHLEVGLASFGDVRRPCHVEVFQDRLGCLNLHLSCATSSSIPGASLSEVCHLTG